MFFNKDKFQELAPGHISRMLPAKDLEAMHGQEVHEFPGVPGEVFVLYTVDGEQKIFKNIRAEWCDENKQAELF